MLSNRSRLERWCCFLDYSLFVVSAGAWNIYCVMMQIQGSETIRATMLCTTPRRMDIASVWNWWELHSICISIFRYCYIVMMCNAFLLLPLYFTDCKWNTFRCGELNLYFSSFCMFGVFYIGRVDHNQTECWAQTSKKLVQVLDRKTNWRQKSDKRSAHCTDSSQQI